MLDILKIILNKNNYLFTNEVFPTATSPKTIIFEILGATDFVAQNSRTWLENCLSVYGVTFDEKGGGQFLIWNKQKLNYGRLNKKK